MRLILFVLFCLCGSSIKAQIDTILFSPVSEYPYPTLYTAYTAHFDRQDRTYIYTANKEYGVIIFDFSDINTLQAVRTFSVQDFQSLKPTDLIQQGNLLFVSLGGFEGLSPQSAGLAIIDISDPVNATILGQWSDSTFNNGCAAIRVDGDYAYLGAMEKGLIIVDVSNPATPQYKSHVELDINWPVPPGVFSVPHARGLALRGDEVWTCFDAGGLRLVDVSDKQFPIEAAKYMNQELDAVAQPAYNTATIVGDYLFAAVDYCGLDVVDISNPNAPQNAAWNNPWACDNLNWAGRPGHTNQLTPACHDSILFVSGADSEVLAYSIVDPLAPRRVGAFATLLDSVATWGIDVNDSLVVLAQIWNPLNIPYLAKKGGIRLLRWSCPQTTSSTTERQERFSANLSPHPVRNHASVQFYLAASGDVQWLLYDLQGRLLIQNKLSQLNAGPNTFNLDLSFLAAGAYNLVLLSNKGSYRQLVLKI